MSDQTNNWVDRLLDDAYRLGKTDGILPSANDYPVIMPKMKAKAKAIIEAKLLEARIYGMQQARARVLRRTEIPRDAREPTRDAIVILGEEIADIISRDVAALQNQGSEGE